MREEGRMEDKKRSTGAKEEGEHVYGTGPFPVGIGSDVSKD
jgi:hypothetical protein